MKNPLLIVGLMVAVAAGVVGAVIVLGNHARQDLRDKVAGQDVSTVIAELEPSSAGAEKSDDRPVASTTGPWPTAVAEKTHFNFGRMAVNSENQHTFVIRNDGDADLLLKTGKSTCKCTTFAVDSTVVEPGEQTQLVIRWKAGEVAEREFHHGGDVYTNDPKSPQINFGVNGAIEMPVEILPNIWNIGRVNQDMTGTLRAAIGSKLTDQFELHPVASPSGKVSVKLTPMSPAERAPNGWLKAYRVDVEVAADIPPGKFDEEVRFNISGIEDLEFVRASLSARKYGSFILQPLEGALFVPDKLLLQLGQFPAAEGRSAKILVIVDEKNMSEPLQIGKIEADPPFITAKLEPLGAPTGTVHRYVLEISVPPGRPRTQMTDVKRGRITIPTNHPTKESIFIEIVMHSH
ncbi:MAG: DUF1573 domain-containing protein [Planctomycetaceae bacterium]